MTKIKGVESGPGLLRRQHADNGGQVARLVAVGLRSKFMPRMAASRRRHRGRGPGRGQRPGPRDLRRPAGRSPDRPGSHLREQLPHPLRPRTRAYASTPTSRPRWSSTPSGGPQEGPRGHPRGRGVLQGRRPRPWCPVPFDKTAHDDAVRGQHVRTEVPLRRAQQRVVTRQGRGGTGSHRPPETHLRPPPRREGSSDGIWPVAAPVSASKT